MTDAELLSYLDGALKDCICESEDQFLSDYNTYVEYYMGEPFGDEIEGESQVVTADVHDVIEADMPSLVRTFLGSSDVLEFEPKSDDEEDVREAEQKTKYINWLVRKQPDSFKILHDWFKSAEFKLGIVKFYPTEEVKTEEVRYEGLSEDERNLMLQDLEAEPGVESVEMVLDDNETDLTFRIRRKRQKIVIKNIPIENFRMSEAAETKDDAVLIGDVTDVTRGELVAEGYTKEFVDKLPPFNAETNTAMRETRFYDQDQSDRLESSEWANQKVRLQQLYVRVDRDGDGIAERRYIRRCSDYILEDEPHEIAPYALLSPILMPHRAIGRGRAEITKPYQYQHSHILRGVMNNIAAVNHPRWGVDDSVVEMDDLLDDQLGGAIRGEGNPREFILPIETPYIGDKALQVIQYIDHSRSQSTGGLLPSQGLDADKLHKETATRFEGVEERADAKIELIARVFAETGLRELFEGLAWTVKHYQDEKVEVRVLGEPLKFNPSEWRYDHYTMSNVGLAAGDTREMIQNLSGMIQLDMQLMEQGSPLTDSKKLYNKFKKFGQAVGIHNVFDYYNDPEKPEEVLRAQNEQLQQAVSQLQEQVNQNPLAEAEEIKARAKLIEAESKKEIEMMKAQLEAQKEADKRESEMTKFMMKQAQEMEQFRREMMAKLTEMDLQNNPQQNDIPGTLEDQ